VAYKAVENYCQRGRVDSMFISAEGHYQSHQNQSITKNMGGIRWVGHVGCMGEVINAYKILGGKPEGKRPLATPTHTWENYIKMYHKDKW
jgi:hypothetical protein